MIFLIWKLEKKARTKMTIFSNLYFFEQVKSRDTTKSEAEKKNI
jgi:hypothetical protein